MAKPDQPASLGEYDQKRDFAVTSEPGPDAAALTSASPRFMVHKHHARRLHYDLRLEIDGALASWAVPRGPSYDPSIKRLAVQTEDHPLAYGDFEGRIPDGQYGAGDSLVWDRGHFDTVPPGQVAAQRRKGHIHFALAGEKLRGEWHLLRTTAANGRRASQGDLTASGPKSQWLMIKLDDEEADPKLDIVAAHPESVLTGRIETHGPEPAGRGHPSTGAKPSMPKLLKTGVLGSEHKDGTGPYDFARGGEAQGARKPTPLFARVPLHELPIDITRPQAILDLPANLFDEPAGKSVGTPNIGTPTISLPAHQPAAELIFLLVRAEPDTDTLGEVAGVALVMRDLFVHLGLAPLACVAGPRALLIRIPIAPKPAPGAIERFAEKIAKTLTAQLAPLKSGEVSLDLSLNKIGAAAPALLEPLPSSPKIICAPLAWEEVDAELKPARFNARWLKSHRDAAQAQAAAHAAAAVPLPRAR